MLLLWLLLLLLLLLPLLAMLWQQRAWGARPCWLISLQHRVSWGMLGWAAAWQQRKLERSTLNAGQSQQQALMWCLKKAQGSCCLPREYTGVFLAPGGGDPMRENNPKAPSFTTNMMWPGTEPYHGLHLTPVRMVFP